MRDRQRDEDKGGADERCDDLIRDGLAPLKRVGMPAGARTSTEQRIQAALAGAVASRDGLWRTWWRRRVSVPFPVAAGLVLFAALLGTLQLRQLSYQYTVDKPEVASTPGPAAAQVSRPQYYEEALYVTGLGFVNSERGYRFFEENNHEVR